MMPPETAATSGPPSHRGTCPYPGCQVQISRRLFACRSHWFALSRPVRAAIYATATPAKILTPERREAVRAAAEEWDQP